MNTIKTDNNAAIAISPGVDTLESIFAAICEALSTGTRENYERAFHAISTMTPYRIKECVNDFIDCYNMHASGCKHQLYVVRNEMKRKVLTAISLMKRYIEHGVQLVFRSDAFACRLRETYYVWDWIDLSDVKGVLRLLKDSEQMEALIKPVDGRRFIHDLNELLRNGLRKVEESAKNDIDDADIIGVWVLNFCDDINDLEARNRSRWEEYVEKYMESRGYTEHEACEELRESVELSMSESDFYIKDCDRDISKLVRHIRSMQGNEEGDKLDNFKLYFAQWDYLSRKMKKLGAVTDFYSLLYRECRERSKEKIAEAEMANSEPLMRFIPDRKKAADYGSALRQCKSAKEAAFVVKDMYDQHLENDEVIVAKDFLEVIQHYLACKGKSVRNLQINIKKIVLGA